MVESNPQKLTKEYDIIRQLKDHDMITPFLIPVDEERDGALDYYSIIKNPMDI